MSLCVSVPLCNVSLNCQLLPRCVHYNTLDWQMVSAMSCLSLSVRVSSCLSLTEYVCLSAPLKNTHLNCSLLSRCVHYYMMKWQMVRAVSCLRLSVCLSLSVFDRVSFCPCERHRAELPAVVSFYPPLMLEWWMLSAASCSLSVYLNVCLYLCIPLCMPPT